MHGAFDLLLTDLELPGLLGLQLADTLCKRFGLPVLVVSGQAAPSNLEVRLGWLQKPFDMALLAEAMKSVIHASCGEPDAFVVGTVPTN